MRRLAWTGALVLGLLTLTGVPTHARFTDAGAIGANTFSTATLAAPSGLSATGGCNGLLQPRVSLSWTASPSTFADGYDIRRSLVSGGPYTTVAHVNGRTTTTYNDAPLTLNTTYYYVVRATAGGWTSANTAQKSATTPLVCV